MQFWSALAAGQMFGDAVSDARRTIFEQSRDNTWAAYQCYGDPGWRLRQVSDSSDTARPVVNLRAWAARRSLELEAQAADLVDARDFRTELEQLEFHIERHWPDHGDLLAALAAAHADIGDLERAEELYARAIADPRWRAPVRAIEQGFNLLCRLALAARHQGDEAAVEALLERLEASRSLVDGLPANAERKALDGAHWKRMAALYGSTVGTEYLDRAIACYVASADNIRLDGDVARNGRPDLYGFRNALQLAALGDQPDPVRPLLVFTWLDAWEADLAPRPARGDISERIGRADSLLAAALLPPDGALDKAIRSVPGDRPLLLPLPRPRPGRRPPWRGARRARRARTAARSAGVARSEVGGARWRTCRRSASSAGSQTVSRSPTAWPTSGRPSSRRVPAHGHSRRARRRDLPRVSMIRLVRRLAQLGVVVLGALGVRRVVARRATLDRVADDLRSPVLYAIPSLRSDRALRVVRRLGRPRLPRPCRRSRSSRARPPRA